MEGRQEASGGGGGGARPAINTTRRCVFNYCIAYCIGLQCYL